MIGVDALWHCSSTLKELRPVNSILSIAALAVFLAAVTFMARKAWIQAHGAAATVPMKQAMFVYARERWLLASLGLFLSLFFAFWGLFFFFLIYAFFSKGTGRYQLKAGRKRYTALAAAARSAWQIELGSDREPRLRTIDDMISEKSRVLAHSAFFDWQKSWLYFELSRSLATMDSKELEFLRLTETLYTMGALPEDRYNHCRFGLLWGNGKASLTRYEFAGDGWDSVNVRDGQGAVRYVMELHNAGVDSTVNELLGVLAHETEASAPDSNLGIVLSSFSKRLSGGNSWLSADEALAPDSVFKLNKDRVAKEQVLYLGPLENGDAPLSYTGEGSMITIAPSRSGKTQCHVYPALLSWRGPAVVLDVKGEIHAETSKWRAEHVGPVFKFSPLDPANSHCYNPLSFVRQEVDWIWADARFLADMMIVPSGASDPFWENKARDVLQAAIAFLCYSNGPDERPMSRLMDIIHGGSAWDEMVTGLQMAVDVRSMMQQGTALSSMSEKTRESVLQTAQGSLSAWSGEQIYKATQRSDWSPLDLRNGSHTTIYICLRPNMVESYISLLRVFIAQHIRMLTAELPDHDADPILFLLDELPRLRHMPPIEEALEIGAGYGLRLWMFAQNLGQMEKAYPNAAGMIGGCAVRIYMNPASADGTTEKLSEELGYRQSVMDGSRQKLVEASELGGPEYQSIQLVMATNSKPARVGKLRAFEHPVYKDRLTSHKSK